MCIIDRKIQQKIDEAQQAGTVLEVFAWYVQSSK